LSCQVTECGQVGGAGVEIPEELMFLDALKKIDYKDEIDFSMMAQNFNINI
jgi:hypothetical protein